MFICRVVFLVAYLICYGDLKGPGYIFNNKFGRAISGNSTWLKLHYFHFGQYNRTVKSANVEMDLNMNVTKDDDVTIYFGFAILKNNEYKKTPINFARKVCSILGTELFDLPNITKNSTFKSCPLHKGRNYIYNLRFTSNGWPRLLPEGSFMLNMDLFYREVLILKFEWMLDIIAT